MQAPPARVRPHRSLRAKTAASFAALTFLTTAVFGVLAVGAIVANERRATAAQAISVLETGTATWQFSGQLPPTLQYGSDGIPESRRSQLGERPQSWDDGVHTWAARRLSSGTILATRLPDATKAQAFMALQRTILGLAAATAAISSLIGYALASALTARLNRAAAHAARLIEQPESAPALEPALLRPGDEISALVVAADTATRELAAALERERTLTADAAHEFRTPVAALIAASELLPEGPDTDRVRRVSDRLARLVEDLLTLRRLQSAPAGVTGAASGLGERASATTLAELVRDCVDADPSAQPVTLEIVDEDGTTSAPELMGVVVANLIANAHAHGRPPIDIAVAGPTVTVSDHGDGYPAELLATGPRRSHPYGATAGTGLGLVIARNAAEAAGADLHFANSAHGAVATISVRAETSGN